MDKKTIEALKETLEKEKATLEKELESFATKDRYSEGWDIKIPNRDAGTMEEEADETQEYDNLLSLEQSLQPKLKAVTIALEKIAKGTYGKCEKCDKEIEAERLSAYPEAKLCMSCNK